jgi:predicted nucleotidyltransferase
MAGNYTKEFSIFAKSKLMARNINNIIITTLMGYNPKRIGIFGSFARNENRHNSDLDVLVKFKKGITLLQLIKLENDLSEKLGIKVDLITEGALTNKKLRKSIAKDLIIIFE